MNDKQESWPPFAADDTHVFAYAGKPIFQRGEYLNLTTMWKATGAAKNHDPPQWLRHEDTQIFQAQLKEHLASPQRDPENLCHKQVSGAKIDAARAQHRSRPSRWWRLVGA